MSSYCINDFTETHYRTLLTILRERYPTVRYRQYRTETRMCLWRHDVDFSLHRAARLAQIEAEHGVTATYFIHLRSEFYNPLETECTRLIRDIVANGHALGLHFDPNHYDELGDARSFRQAVAMERNVLEALFDTEIDVFSLHNPTLADPSVLELDEVAGLINTYGPYLRQHFGYCSDSNGYWRHERLRDLLENAPPERLQVLTHPVWWVPQPMAPFTRVERCAEGRRSKQIAMYLDVLKRSGRTNVTEEVVEKDLQASQELRE